jgi:phage shock protein E
MNLLAKLVNERIGTILDVRSVPEFHEGHFPGAKNVSVDQIPVKIEDLKKLPQPFVLYCRSGSRSTMALMILKQHGFEEVYNAGGLMDIEHLSLQKTS